MTTPAIAIPGPVVSNTLSGRVEVKESAVPIPGLQINISLSSGLPTAPALHSLGTWITDGNGQFTATYQDAEFQVFDATLKRPSLVLTVLAPDEPGVAQQARQLYTSSGPWQAGRNEARLIRIPSAALAAAGIALPGDDSISIKDPLAAIDRMKQAVSSQVSLAQATQGLASGQADASRAAAQASDAVIEPALIQKLTGVTPQMADRLNLVLPGASAEPTQWKAVNKTIDQKVNTAPMVGYLVLPAAEAAQFKDNTGHWLSNIPAPQIEPYIYNPSTSASRSTGPIFRSDPTQSLSQGDGLPDVTLPPPGNPGGNGVPPPPPADPPVKTTDLPNFLGRLLDDMPSPESNPDGSISGRPTADDVQSSVRSLQLGAGPADVTAFYDYHQLTIAFDYVWQQLIDQGIIDTGKALAQTLTDRGGAPLPAVQAGQDPIQVLRAEVKHVGAAKTSLLTAGVAMMMAPGQQGGSGGHPPPLLRPPFLGGVVVSAPGVFVQPQPAEPGDLLAELDALLVEQYKFEVFAPGSTNFGLLITYRQKWDPITYQVGNLVKTLTLAPKETRKVTSKRTVRRERSSKELEDNQRNRKDETSQTMRDEAEVVMRAQQKTNFSLSAKGSYDIGIADGDMTTGLTRDNDASSQETKKSFHEATLKSAQEYRDEHKLEVEVKEVVETEVTDSAEITNPNDELTVTYLFYELQRRYRVSEHLHHLTPVVLVAMEVPNPNRDAIDQTLLAHQWIINRVLLDDRYRAGLDYLCTRIVGDELALQSLANNAFQVYQAVQDLKTMHKDVEALLNAREASLQAAMEARANAVTQQDNTGWGEKAWDAIVGSGNTDDLEAARIREDSAKDAYDRSVADEKDLRMRLDAETAALDAANAAYAKAYAEHGNRLLQIAGLRQHFKENVLYYTQAIWSFTHRDQIFFSLLKTKVPHLTAATKTYSLVDPAQVPLSIAPKPGQVVAEVHANLTLTNNLDPNVDFDTLVEVADLDHPLGFKGNYMIFPLKASNPLTDFMMLPYLDAELGLHDPDDLGSWTPEDFVNYARTLQQKMKDQLSPSDYQALQNQLEAQYKQIVSSTQVTTDEVVLPTSSLYLEALPGAHPLLENFKLQHRWVDVLQARADLRKRELENLRFAARVLEDKLDDPSVDKKILVEGTNSGVVVGGP